VCKECEGGRQVKKVQQVGQRSQTEWHFVGFQQLRVCKVVAICVTGISGKSGRFSVGVAYGG